VTLISVGFVVERVGVSTGSPGASTVFGVALAALGVLALAMGTAQYFRTRRRISAGAFAPAALAYLMIVAGAVLLGGAFMIYVLLAASKMG